MARKAATIEFLTRIVAWAGGRQEFCRLTGVQPANLSAYLSGGKQVSWQWLKTATSKVYDQPPAFHPVLEGYDLSSNGLPKLSALPKVRGVYALYDSAMRVIYYGKATSLYMEVRQTLNRHVREVRPWSSAKNLTFRDISVYLSAYTLVRGDVDFVHDLEAFGLRLLVNNTFNKKGGYFKRSK